MRQRIVVSIGAVIVAAAAACIRDKAAERSADGSLDKAASLATVSAITPALGPGVQVTRTDAASVRQSTEYKLTDQNFAKFVRAADSVAALQGRDSSVRNRLSSQIAGAASPDLDAGVKWLESDTAVVRAITASGLSPRDYYVMAIAIASAEQHLANPSAAPPTPALQQNAEFLRHQAAALAHLHDLERGKPGVVVTP